MTRSQFVNVIAVAESDDKVKAVGDHGLAAGRFQMHWDWREDFWPAWAWECLALLDRYALEHWLAYNRDGSPRKPATARALADLYNLGHQAPDPAYDLRVLQAMESLGITQDEYDKIVEGV